MNSEKYRWKKNEMDLTYRRKHIRSTLFLVFLLLLLATSVLLSLWVGTYNTPLRELIQAVFYRASDEKINMVVRNMRLPRICTSMVAGAGLGLAGCILQSILHNPIASASTLGVSQGAGFGAALAIIVFQFATDNSHVWIPVIAFAGSMTVAFLILVLSKAGQVSPESIVLAGVAVSSMLSGVTTLLQYFADEVELMSFMFWTFGDLGSTSWSEIFFMLIILVLTGCYGMLHRWDYNALLGGDEMAISLGVNVKKLTITNMILCCFLVSVIVSYVGLINFIGLIAPHMVRMVVGNNHVYLIPGSILAGATLLLSGDLLSRIIISPVVLPIGAVTSFLGAPLFLYLLFRRKEKIC